MWYLKLWQIPIRLINKLKLFNNMITVTQHCNHYCIMLTSTVPVICILFITCGRILACNNVYKYQINNLLVRLQQIWWGDFSKFGDLLWIHQFYPPITLKSLELEFAKFFLSITINLLFVWVSSSESFAFCREQSNILNIHKNTCKALALAATQSEYLLQCQLQIEGSSKVHI